MPASSRPNTGVAVLALLAVVDISWLVQAWFGVLDSPDAPPTAALIVFALLGVVTLVTVRPALRGNRTAAWIMVGSRVVSVLLVDLPAFALGAPVWVDVIASAAILLTALGVWWASSLLSQAGAARAATRAAI